MSVNPGTVIENPSARFPWLAEIHHPPGQLFYRGEVDFLSTQICVAVVGTRRASPYGLHMAWKLAMELAEAGVAVISGLALGIDGAAHRGALRAGGKTAAILGCGLDRIYPREHTLLADAIVRAGGAILSEYPAGSAIHKSNFPQRNRLVAGLCRGVVVIEAPQKSGALITADLALTQNREVFAVPGPADQQSFGGCHWLIQQGAKLVTSAQDILDEVSQTAVNDRKTNSVAPSELQKSFELAGGFLSFGAVQRLAERSPEGFWSDWSKAVERGSIVESSPQWYSWMPRCE